MGRRKRPIPGPTGACAKSNLHSERDPIALLEAGTNTSLPPHILVDSGFSVEKIAPFGIIRSCRAMMLIDANANSWRFFSKKTLLYLKQHKLTDFDPQVSSSDTYDTEEEANRNFAASEFLPASARAPKTVGGPPIYVGSPSSKLAEVLPVF